MYFRSQTIKCRVQLMPTDELCRNCSEGRISCQPLGLCIFSFGLGVNLVGSEWTLKHGGWQSWIWWATSVCVTDNAAVTGGNHVSVSQSWNNAITISVSCSCCTLHITRRCGRSFCDCSVMRIWRFCWNSFDVGVCTLLSKCHRVITLSQALCAIENVIGRIEWNCIATMEACRWKVQQCVDWTHCWVNRLVFHSKSTFLVTKVQTVRSLPE